MKCKHTGPYRAVQASQGELRGSCFVMCTGCGGFQHPAGGVLDRPVCSMMQANPRVTDPWSGTHAKYTDLPENVALTLLSLPLLDLVDAHRVALRFERILAEHRRDGVWFINHGEIAPWHESKRCPTSGDILVRPRAGWVPSAYPTPDL